MSTCGGEIVASVFSFVRDVFTTLLCSNVWKALCLFDPTRMRECRLRNGRSEADGVPATLNVLLGESLLLVSNFQELGLSTPTSRPNDCIENGRQC